MRQIWKASFNLFVDIEHVFTHREYYRDDNGGKFRISENNLKQLVLKQQVYNSWFLVLIRNSKFRK